MSANCWTHWRTVSFQVWAWSEEGVETKHVEELNLNLGDRRLRLTLDLARQLQARRDTRPNTLAASC